MGKVFNSQVQDSLFSTGGVPLASQPIIGINTNPIVGGFLGVDPSTETTGIQFPSAEDTATTPPRLITNISNIDWPKARAIDNAVLYADVPWIGDTSNRNFVPAASRIDAAVDSALSVDNVYMLYIDDSQSLSRPDLLQLAYEVKRRSSLPLGYYAQPVTPNRYVRNVLNNDSNLDGVWDSYGDWSAASYRGKNFEGWFDLACPSLYVFGDMDGLTDLTDFQSWHITSTDVMHASRHFCSLPHRAFVGILDETLAEDTDFMDAVAARLYAWDLDVILWGGGSFPDQSLFADALESAYS